MIKDKKQWSKTDDDSVQYRREATELEDASGKVFELFQIQAVREITESEDDRIYAIAHDYVYVSEIDTQSVLDAYGYGSMEELRQEYKEDAEAIIAECQFELDSGCLENLSRRMPLMTWQQAKETIEKMIES